MGRKRQSGDKLPKYVYPKGNWYVYRPYVDGRMGKPVPLVKIGAPMSDVWAALEQVLDTSGPTVRRMMQTYLKENTRLAARTRADYGQHLARLAGEPLKGGRLFGDVDPDHVTQLAIRQYLDRHSATPTAANRRIQFLKAAYAWAAERGRVRLNPCTGVRLHSTPGRDRYVTDAEYTAVLELAQQWAGHGRYPYLWIMMELAYLLRARRAEVTALRRDMIDGDTIGWPRAKGSRPERTRITPRLRRAIEAGKRLEADIASPYLVHRRGQPIRKNAFDSAWQRLMHAALEAELVTKRYTFHDLKAKGVSDHAEHHSGHRSERMRDHYNRRPDDVEATK